MTTPTGGEVTVTRTGATASLPGFTVLTGLIQITAPTATPAAPLTLSFVIDASLIPPGETPDTIQVTKNGVVVSDCTGSSGEAVPDPCVSARLLLAGGAAQITVLTTTASDWGFGVSLCASTPARGCRKAIKAPIVIKKGISAESDVAVWKWSGGFTTKSNFGNPLTQTDYALCAYDEHGGIPGGKLRVVASRGGACAGKPCWEETSGGFQYRAKALTPDGSLQLKLQVPARGPTKLAVKGRGSALGVPTLPFDQTPAVIVQLRSSEGMCWEATYSAATTNTTSEFKAKSD